ncbi:MAG: hypothetical protein IJY79_01705 [Clostridia bacterium]|nr:hypothetical protein [Clostridia bacterium]
MKNRHTLTLLCVLTPVCVMLRAIQLIFTIDSTTGFIKQQYTAISVLITVIVCAAIASMAMLAASVDEIKERSDGKHPSVAIACMLTGGMFIYQTVARMSVLNAWYDILLVLLTLMSVFVFVAYGLKNIYDYKMPDIMLVIPVLYYVIKLISVFVSTSALALVTENIFLIFTNSVLLWFMYEFASFENRIGDIAKKPKKLFASGLAAVMLCAVTAIPKLILLMTGKTEVSSGDVSAALLNISVGIFIITYIISNFYNKDEVKKSVPKHLA